MPALDLIFILKWWITLFLIGIVFLPSTSLLFFSFFDRGYIFSKIIALSTISYIVLVMGATHIAPFTTFTLISIIFIFTLFNLALIFYKSGGPKVKKTFLIILKQKWIIFAFEEMLFVAALFFWSYVRAHQPDIHGLEKYMDFGFVNSILRSRYFPPRDMWFTPFSINYYYFGHLVTAVLTKLSGITSNITFNLMVAALFALTFTASFSIGANLIYQFKIQKAKFRTINQKLIILFAGLLTAFLVSLSGNLHTIYTFFTPYANENPVPPWQLPFSPATFPNNYWYPNATRFIYHTIHEFPSYSFVVSDLHGHVLDIPFVFLTIAILLSLIFKSQDRNHKTEINSDIKTRKYFNFLNFGGRKSIWDILPISFLLAVMYMTNAWDGIIYFLLAMFVILCLNLRTTAFNNSPQEMQNAKRKTQNHIVKFRIFNFEFSFFALRFAIYVLTIGIGFLLFSLPFNIFFKPFVSGIGIICAPEFLTRTGKIGPLLFEPNHCQRSPLWQLLILYGFFYFWTISFIAVILKKIKTKKYILYASDVFVLLLILLSTILIIIPEFIYVKDIYPTYYRANTMFKLVYQSFIMLSVSSGYIIIRMLLNLKLQIITSRLRMLWLGFWIVGFGIFILVAIYPYFAINSYYVNFKSYYGLDGTTYLKTLYPTDYKAILWLNKNIKGQPVILEAQGDSYTDFARVSANTGLPTVLGWTVHEWLWRGSYDVPAPRISQVELLYESPDINLTRQFIKAYNIKFVFVGDLERQKYPNLNEEKFKKLGRLVFHDGNTKIYKINYLGF